MFHRNVVNCWWAKARSNRGMATIKDYAERRMIRTKWAIWFMPGANEVSKTPDVSKQIGVSILTERSAGNEHQSDSDKPAARRAAFCSHPGAGQVTTDGSGLCAVHPLQTTERYLGSDQEIEIAVNENLGL